LRRKLSENWKVREQEMKHEFDLIRKSQLRRRRKAKLLKVSAIDRDKELPNK